MIKVGGNMYEVMIDDFQGPLDLLLHLIKESKMDIFNIKLEIIIDEYLKYIQKMQDLNLDVASSYLVMSCELLEIKSKMLLPRNSEEEVEDNPKDRLINRLIEYQKYKEQIENFRKLEQERNMYYTKVPSNILDYKTESNKIVLNDVSLNDLVEAFQKFLERKKEDEPVNTKITKKELSVEERIDEIRNVFKNKHSVNFFDLFKFNNKPNLVVTFLAILELAKMEEIRIIQEDNFAEIVCEVVNGS